MFKTPNRSKKQQETDLLNAFCSCHDLTCHCKNPLFHCLQIIASRLGPELKAQEKQQIKECLGDTTATKDGDAGDLDIGELEKLFAQDTTEDVDG